MRQQRSQIQQTGHAAQDPSAVSSSSSRVYRPLRRRQLLQPAEANSRRIIGQLGSVVSCVTAVAQLTDSRREADSAPAPVISSFFGL